MLRRLPVALLFCVLVSASAYGWIAMGDGVGKLRPFPGLRPQPAPHKVHPAADHGPGRLPSSGLRPNAPIQRPEPTGQLPVRALRWVAPDGASLIELPGAMDLLTDALSPPEGAWADVEILLGDEAWLDTVDLDLAGETLTLTLSDPDAAGPLVLDWPESGDPAGALLVPLDE